MKFILLLVAITCLFIQFFLYKRPKVIVTCFGGREFNLKILNKYIDKLIEQRKIDEFHLWNFTRTPEDDLYVKSLSNKYIIKPVEDKKSWGEYYTFYKNSNDNDIIIKLDDDILFIDVGNFDNFIKERRRNNCLLLFPSILNNGVCAYHQQQNGLLPESLHKFKYETWLGEVVMNGKLGTDIHLYFTQNSREFIQKSRNLNKMIDIPIGDRTSINFFAILGKDFKKLEVSPDDEPSLTIENTKRLNMNNSIFMDFVVSHGAFGGQRTSGLDELYICSLYSKLE